MSDKAKPKRIQRRRVKGWRMPDGAVSVTRPGRWGNPFQVDVATSMPALWLCIESADSLKVLPFTSEECVALYRVMILGLLRDEPDLLAPLRGKDLACWCNLGDSCHADVLLELANRESA
jgi:hypothetical protein